MFSLWNWVCACYLPPFINNIICYSEESIFYLSIFALSSEDSTNRNQYCSSILWLFKQLIDRNCIRVLNVVMILLLQRRVEGLEYDDGSHVLHGKICGFSWNEWYFPIDAWLFSMRVLLATSVNRVGVHRFDLDGQ